MTTPELTNSFKTMNRFQWFQKIMMSRYLFLFSFIYNFSTMFKIFCIKLWNIDNLPVWALQILSSRIIIFVFGKLESRTFMLVNMISAYLKMWIIIEPWRLKGFMGQPQLLPPWSQDRVVSWTGEHHIVAEISWSSWDGSMWWWCNMYVRIYPTSCQTRCQNVTSYWHSSKLIYFKTITL